MTNFAFIYPGQGSQKVGMLAEIAQQSSVISETFAEASEVLGYDLWALVQNGPQETLNLTEKTQPMLLAASVALYRLWLQKGGSVPALMAGHSLGEWSALVCSGVVSFKDAVQIVQLRGKFMQEAVPDGVGSMAAIIGLDGDIIAEVCDKAAENEVVSAVNYNSPGQVVIAGNVQAVNRACEICKELGAKRAVPLAVSAPFHSTLLKPAADRLEEHLSQVRFTAPSVTVIQNVDGLAVDAPELIKQRMIRQIYHPVLWVSCVKALAQSGAEVFVECGPGKVLSGLNKRIDRSLSSYAVETPSGFEAALTALESQHA